MNAVTSSSAGSAASQPPASQSLPHIGEVARRRRPLLWWDLGVAATVAVMGVIGYLDVVLDEDPGSLLDLATTLGVLALLVVWYLCLGRSALRRAVCEEPARPSDLVYLSVLVLIVGAATAILPSYATLQALAYPMIWTIIARYRDAVIWSAVLALAVGAGFLLAFERHGVLAGFGEASAIVVLSFTFAVVMGTWISRIFAQGERYRALAEQLRASQAEVAALSEQAGAGRERDRLSRELHDTLTQTLAGLVMLSEQAQRALDSGDAERARDRLSRVGEAAREAVGEARALVATTQPLGDGGLEAAIERVAARLSADAGLRVECALDTVSLDREHQVVLLRAAQEGLANARKHARASRVLLTLTAPAEGGVVLLVEDDGVGPDPERMRLGGFGLSGLAERVREVGGEVRFGEAGAGGARLEVRLPGEASRVPSDVEPSAAGAEEKAES
ncbi:sensor histidine kinase [Leucobacter celer]|uniref:sensor histidine kinase n=1 Tax=Leucobacter celer TaxID=668625 RepID=UPI0009F9616F|nr:sensor histidine kinase [Leucobacter celer]